MSAIEETIVWPLKHEELGQRIGLTWHKRLLIYGPPGCGKSTEIKRVAEETQSRIVTIAPSQVIQNHVGGSETALRRLFAQALQKASITQPIVLHLKSLEQLGPRRTKADAHGSRLCTQLLTLLDGASQHPGIKFTAIIATTQHLHGVDPALRRAGRFDRELGMGLPDLQVRAERIKEVLKDKRLPGLSLDPGQLAAATAGHSHAAVAGRLRNAVLDQALATRQGVSIRQDAVPSREIHADHWDAIGGLQEAKQQLKQAVMWPLQHGRSFKRLGIAPPRGVLLHGPPGCCKTTLIRAAARASGAFLQQLTVSDLYRSHLGEGEAHLRATFKAVQQARPAILLLDELDSMFPRRSSSSSSRSNTETRLLSTLLTELDGVQALQGVVLIGATNCPERVDPALLRPGRLDVHIAVPLPNEAERVEILKIHARRMPVNEDVDFEALGAMTSGCSGADLKNLCQEAALLSLSQTIWSATANTGIQQQHFLAALKNVAQPLH